MACVTYVQLRKESTRETNPLGKEETTLCA
jgi:hypothetical protein